ncbi:MAG: hypothetical protein K4571_06280 [Deltaproteobacteria bacterium]
MKPKYLIMAALMMFAGIAGCSPEPRSVTLHEPGVYKGDRDPVLELKQHQELNHRFKLVQSDR